MIVKGGSTDVTTYFQMRLTAGGDATGLTISDFDLSYTRSGATTAAKVDATALAAANTAHTDNYGIEVDATDCPGLYRFDWPDAAFAASVREVILTVKHASCFTESLRVQIDPLGAPAGATLAADIAAIKSETATIVADTNELQTDWVNGGRLDLLLDATLADTNELQTDWANGGRLDLLLDATLADTNELQTDWANGGRLDLIVDAILDDTDLIDDGTSGLAKIATDVAAILVDTGTTLDGKINTVDTVVDAIKAKTDSLTFTVAGQVDSNVQYVNDVAVTGTGALGDEWGPV